MAEGSIQERRCIGTKCGSKLEMKAGAGPKPKLSCRKLFVRAGLSGQKLRPELPAGMLILHLIVAGGDTESEEPSTNSVLSTSINDRDGGRFRDGESKYHAIVISVLFPDAHTGFYPSLRSVSYSSSLLDNPTPH